MCGISGILSVDARRVTTERLNKMTTAIAHRGPDGEGSWISGSGVAGLGHRRLSIIDLSSAGAQPMHYLHRYTIIHNGEVYNHPELRSLLQTKGYSFSSRTDTEVIAAAYDHFGTGCLEHFDGMFAFAIWDEQEKRLFLARDRFGEKPLFFYRDAEQLLFASEIKALWAAGIPREVNRKMLFNFLTIGYTQNPADGFETFFLQIQKLPPRCFLIYHPLTGQMETNRWWDIQPEKTLAMSGDEAAGTFSGLFQASVKRRLRSDVGIGASLSGGLDSSSVVSCILRQTNAPLDLPTFSAVFPGFEKDESAFVRLVTQHFSLANHTITPTADDLIRDFERLAYHQEEPFLSSSIYAQFRVYGLAAANSIKVLLDGQGADELLAGYPKYFSWYWRELYRRDRKTLTLELEAARSAGIRDRWTWKDSLAAKYPDYAGQFIRWKRSTQQRSNRDLAKDFVRGSGASYYDAPQPGMLNSILYYNTFINGMEELLRYADRNSMAHGVEIRLPFLDPALATFIFSLPADLKIRNGWTKWLLRKSMGGILPGDIAWRRDKTGFDTPQKTWMQHPGLEEYIHEARRSLVKAGILKDEVLQKKIQPQEVHAAENKDWRYLVSAKCL